ncbi:MAG: hypothetical protein M5U25_07820 [Planctomycetota bacterium]|nr:hypothetical protein [Planctomycetota bacterium]
MSMSNAGRMGQNQLLRQLIEDGPYNVQIALEFPFYGILGKQLDITTTPRFLLPTATALAPCGPIKEFTRSPDIKSFPIVEITSRYELCQSDVDTIDYPNNLYSEEDLLGIRDDIYEYFRLIVVGSAAPFFPSLDSLTDQILNLGGAPAQLEDFDRALTRVTTENGYDVVAMGNQSALRAFWSARYERGVPEPTWLQDVPNSMLGRANRPTPYVHHARFLVNEMIPNRTLPDGQLVTNLYFMQMGMSPDSGTGKGVFGIIPAPRVGNMFIRRDVVGRPQDDGTFDTSHNVFWSFPSGIAVAARRSLSVLQDFLVTPD